MKNKEEQLAGKYLTVALLSACLFAPCMVQASELPHPTASIDAVEQSQTVKGQVLDEAGSPIIGANIIVRGTNVGCITDLDGKFSIHGLKLPITLEVSFIGYKSQIVDIKSNKPLVVTLKTDDNLMDEVIVTGYGTYKKSAYAGSASAVNSKKLKDIPSVSFQNMLQGNASGVQFTQESGIPGAATNINIRGMGSFNASNSPLYVVDGVPVMSGSIDATGSYSGLDIMSTINPTDIENISIIKDAAAASLYGSRAANGVILITTKRGKEGKAKIGLKADWGFSDFAMEYRPVMNGEQRREYIYNGLFAGKKRGGATDEEAKAYADEEVEYYAPKPWCGYTNWDDVLFKKGSYQNYEATVSGGTKAISYYSSLAYTKQSGITSNSGLERVTGRMNVDFQATNKLKVGANLLLANVTQDVYSEGTAYSSPFYTSRNAIVPSDPVYNEDGSWNRELIRIGDHNPLLSMTYDTSKEYVVRTFNTIYAQYELIKNLRFKSTLSYDYTHIKGVEWNDPRTSSGDDVNGEMYKKYKEYRKMVWANQLSYKFDIKKNHHFDVLAGYETDEKYHDYLYGDASNFATFQKPAISNGMKEESISGYDTKTRLISYLTRLNYDYKNKYYFGASFRTDGSSKLASDNRWGNFWSVSGAWKIGEETFMNPVKGWLTDLKLRASYGVNGTLPSDYFGYMGLSGLTSGYLSMPSISPSQIENKDLKWETNHNINIGLDFGICYRINATIEWYQRTTKDLLMDCPISYTTGFSSYLMNIGKIKNTGIELEIKSKNIDTKDFSWDTNFNLSHNQNKIMTLDGKQTEIISGSQIHKVGKSYRTFYLAEFAGINPETGAPQFYTNTLDENGNYQKDITEKASEANAIALDKHAEPTVTGGLSNNFRYKWFDFSFMFSYQFGGYSYDNWAQKTEHGGNDLEASIPTYYADSWKKPGDVTRYELFIERPATPMNKVKSTRRLHSTDFIRLKSLTFGITVPKNWTNKVGINNARIYASANNLWTWAAHDYYDPESVKAGSATWNTPPLKTVTFGINVNF